MSRVGFTGTALEIAEALWLARHLPAIEAPAAPPRAPRPTPPAAEPPATEPAAVQPPATEPPAAEVHAPAARDEAPRAPVGGTGIPLPRPPAIAHPRDLQRALRPLMRRVPSRTRRVLDEAATVDATAELSHDPRRPIIRPCLRPARERWLDIALIIDDATTMALWRDTVDDLHHLLTRLGAFRDVRAYQLDAAGPTLRLAGAPVSPKALADPTGRRLFLVVSDCVHGGWRDGRVAAMLGLWARHAPVSLVQMLPRRLWARSALGEAPGLRLGALTPAAPNRQTAPPDPHGLPIAVTTLDPDALHRWARFVAGQGETTGAALSLDAAEGDPPPPDHPPAERVHLFHAVSSPTAQRLAALLAAVPLELPIIRLVQRTAVPEADCGHLAEVMLGGLMRGTKDEQGQLHLDFREGIRTALLGSASRLATAEVLIAVSRWLRDQGRSTIDVAALLLDPDTHADPIPADARPFARIVAEVLLRIGGPAYAGVAKRLLGDGDEPSGPVRDLVVTMHPAARDAWPEGLPRDRAGHHHIVTPDGAWHLAVPPLHPSWQRAWQAIEALPQVLTARRVHVLALAPLSLAALLGNRVAQSRREVVFHQQTNLPTGGKRWEAWGPDGVAVGLLPRRVLVSPPLVADASVRHAVLCVHVTRRLDDAEVTAALDLEYADGPRQRLDLTASTPGQTALRDVADVARAAEELAAFVDLAAEFFSGAMLHLFYAGPAALLMRAAARFHLLARPLTVYERLTDQGPRFAAAVRFRDDRLILRDPATQLRPAMVPIPGGTFRMGSPEGEQGRWKDEGPQLPVTLSPHLMAVTPVTQAQYRSVTGASPSHFAGDRRPVEQVSWLEAAAYCNALSEREGLSPAYTAAGKRIPGATGYRLPTEAQWEHACRAGTTTRYWSGDAEAELARVGWYSANSGGETHPVAEKPPNPWGLFDLHGNVYEWCDGWWAGRYRRGSRTDPMGPTRGDRRVFRGGSFAGPARYARAAYRAWDVHGDREWDRGFRVVRPAPQLGGGP